MAIECSDKHPTNDALLDSIERIGDSFDEGQLKYHMPGDRNATVSMKHGLVTANTSAPLGSETLMRTSAPIHIITYINKFPLQYKYLR